MNKETGEIKKISPEQAEHKAKEGEIIFSLGEIIKIKDQDFIICDIKNNRMIVRSAKLPPTLRELRKMNLHGEHAKEQVEKDDGNSKKHE